MFSRLPPVGNPVCLRTAKKPVQTLLQEHYPGYMAQLTASGTEALATALGCARQAKPDSSHQEVIIPGYGCPDLVSAAVYAGLIPVLVDLEPNSHQMSLKAVRDALTENTTAIVAVNFLGLPERLEMLRAIADDANCLLVEDNAQWFPEPQETLYGDFVITSFGRGKPVNLLGGGLLLMKESLDFRLPDLHGNDHQLLYGCHYIAKATAYNLLTTPYGYGVLDRLPFTHIGETHYKHLEDIGAISATAAKYLEANIKAHLKRPLDTQQRIREILQRNSSSLLLDMTASHSQPDKRLLRYPVLAADKDIQRDLLVALTKAGLGVTNMYGARLDRIGPVADFSRVSGSLENAGQFSQQLLTLPVHSRVSRSHLHKLEEVLKKHGCQQP